MKKTTLLLLLAILFCYTATAQPTVQFENITDAMYDVYVDREAVKKIIFTGEIQGDDYEQHNE